MIKQKKNDYINYLKKQKREKHIILISQVGLLVIFVIIWEIFARLNIINSFIFSSPSKIFKTIIDLYNSNELFYHIGVTLLEAIVGFVLATALGSLIAIILWWSSYLKKLLDPYLVVLNSLPKIALGPILIIWFGAGTNAIIAMAVLIVIIITILTMLNAFNSVDSQKIILLKSMNASKFQILIKLILPSSLPKFISVLKINVGLSWVGVIMGEYLVSRAGLGYLIVYGGQVFKLDLVMSSTVILCVLAGLMYALVAMLEKHLIKN